MDQGTPGKRSSEERDNTLGSLVVKSHEILESFFEVAVNDVHFAFLQNEGSYSRKESR